MYCVRKAFAAFVISGVLSAGFFAFLAGFTFFEVYGFAGTMLSVAKSQNVTIKNAVVLTNN